MSRVSVSSDPKMDEKLIRRGDRTFDQQTQDFVWQAKEMRLSRKFIKKENYNFFLVYFVLRPVFLLCLNNRFPARLKFCRFSAKLESASSEFESQLSAQKVDFQLLE